MNILSAIRTAAMALCVVLATVLPAAAASLTVGGKDFTEQLLMAEITKQLLEAKGYTVVKKDGMGSTILRAALENGEVDIYWEYTGTSLVVFNKITDRLSAEKTYETVRGLDAKKGLIWLTPSKANDTYALAIRPNNPKTDNIKTLSELAAAYNRGENILIASTAEFSKREDGILGLQKTYGFKAGRANVKPLEIGLVYNALSQGSADVAVVNATDGRIASMKLTLLKDDKGFFPNYALAPVIRKETLDAHPDLKGILESISAKLDDPTMQRLNGEVDVDKKTVEDVAKGFLKQAGLIGG